MKFKALIGVALMSCSLYALAESQPEATLKTKEDKLSYSLGAVMAEQLKQFDGISADALSQGIKDVLNNKPVQLQREEMFQLIEVARKDQEQKFQQKMLAEAKKNLEKGQAFLSENGKKPGVKTLESGLQYKVLTKGTGVKPAATDEVVVHYEGKLLDGTIFDSSYDRGQPATFRLNQVIRGWTEALKQMPAGSKWELYIPSDLAYGPGGIPGRIGPNEVLVFKVELQEVKTDGSKKQTESKKRQNG